jgi:uncharacterized protein (TIGR04255 family)
VNQLLPKFEKPPVVEVAVSVQFSAPVLDGPLLMLRWTQVRDRFPRYEQVSPLPSSVETFSNPRGLRFEFQFSDAPPTPRLLMLNESETEVLQIQEDRLGYSWRRLSNDHEYPHYPSIRESFLRELIDFEGFLSSENLAPLNAVQCEVTYVNLIPAGQVGEHHSDLGKILPSVEFRRTETFLPDPEQTTYASQFVIIGDSGEPIARLYVMADPSFAASDRSPIYILKLTVRGAPQGPGTVEIIKSMDLGHEWIVRAFATLTSGEMQKVWERTA